jgi:MFS family permease
MLTGVAGAEPQGPEQPGGSTVPPDPLPEAPAASATSPAAATAATDAQEVRWPVLATRNSRLLLGTRLAGQASDGLLQAALGSFVLFSPERQATAAQVAASFALLLLPYSLIGPFAGVLLDRWSRARVLVVANLARAAVMLAVAALVADDRDGLDLGATVLIAMGLGRLVLAGLSAGLPHVVDARHLVTANALFPTAGTIAAAVATVTGLVLMPRLGPDGASHLVVGVAAGLVLAALIASRIPRDDLGPEPADPAVARSLTRDLVAVVAGMAAGVGHVHERIAARRALGVVVLHRFAFGALLVDALLLVRNTLNAPTQADAALADFALAAGGASLGSLLAALTTPTAARRIGVTRWAGITLLVAALAGPLAFARISMPLIVLGSLFMGFSGQAVKIAGDTVIQREVDDDFRGRVFALYDVVVNVALVAGIFLTAFTVSPSGISGPLWIGIGALLLATGAWSLRPAPVDG